MTRKSDAARLAPRSGIGIKQYSDPGSIRRDCIACIQKVNSADLYDLCIVCVCVCVCVRVCVCGGGCMCIRGRWLLIKECVLHNTTNMKTAHRGHSVHLVAVRSEF